MIVRRPAPMTGRLTGVWGSGNPEKPKGLKKYDLGGGVGLGIVAALEKADLVFHNHKPNKPILFSRSINFSMEMGQNEEDYTFVTCHGPNKTNTGTKVYYDGGHPYVKRKENMGFNKKIATNSGCCMFYISPPRFSDDHEDIPESDFLSSCHLCRKTLHGKDIYMYRGEKAYCSTECRYVQIKKDERKEKELISRLVSSRSSTTTADISTTSPYNTTTNGLVFATGILAT